MNTATTVLVVGGALLAPSLLAGVELGPGDSPAAKDPSFVSPSKGHRAAVEQLRSRVVAGTSDDGNNGDSIHGRVEDCFNALRPLRGSASEEFPGFPNATAAEAVDILTALLDACAVGIAAGIDADDTQRDRAYVLSPIVDQDFDPLDGAIDIFDKITNPKLVPQKPILDIIQNVAGGTCFDPDACVNGGARLDLTNVGRAAFRAALEKRNANIGGSAYSAVRAMRAASELSVQMDFMGAVLRTDPVEQLKDAFVDSAKNLPGRLVSAGKDAGALVGDLFGGALGGLLTSTPVLIVAGAVLLYKVSNK